MDAVLIGTRVALVGVFAVAAVAKLLDMAGSRRALEGFGVPGPLVPSAALALPVLELTAAALLVIAPTAQAGAALAGILLVSFIAAIVFALRDGAAPDCHCFGQLHSRPAGRGTAARNVVLAFAAALVVAVGPGPGIASWVSHSGGTSVALVCVGLLAVVLVYAGLSLWYQNRLLAGRRRLPIVPAALQVGEEVPEVNILTEGGTNVAVRELVPDDRPAVFIFTDARCEPCRQVLPELARWRETLSAQLDIHVLAAGDAQQNIELAAAHGLPLLLDPDGAAAHAFGVEGTPSAIEIDATGLVAGPAALGPPAIQGLIRASLGRPANASDLEVRYFGATRGTRPLGAAS